MPAQRVVQSSTAMASSESLVLQVLQAAAAAEVKPAVNVEQASMATAILALPVQPAVHAVAAEELPALSVVQASTATASSASLVIGDGDLCHTTTSHPLCTIPLFAPRGCCPPGPPAGVDEPPCTIR